MAFGRHSYLASEIEGRLREQIIFNGQTNFSIKDYILSLATSNKLRVMWTCCLKLSPWFKILPKC